MQGLLIIVWAAAFIICFPVACMALVEFSYPWRALGRLSVVLLTLLPWTPRRLVAIMLPALHIIPERDPMSYIFRWGRRRPSFVVAIPPPLPRGGACSSSSGGFILSSRLCHSPVPPLSQPLRPCPLMLFFLYAPHRALCVCLCSVYFLFFSLSNPKIVSVQNTPPLYKRLHTKDQW